METNRSSKFLAFLLAFLMMFGLLMFPAATVLAEENNTQTAEDTPKLLNLSVIHEDSQNLVEGFSSDTYSYSINVPYNVDSVSISASPQAEGDTVDGLGEFTLNNGENTFNVTVYHTADGAEPVKQYYSITVNRAQAASDDCGLKSLAITAGDTPLTLEPAFDTAVTEYKAAAAAGSVSISGEANDTEAKIDGLGSYDIVIGDNILSVSVTAADGTVKKYNITITGLDPAVTTLDASDFQYSISGGKATIIGYIGEGGDIVTPTYLGGCPVTAIGDYAFDWLEGITGITISSGVTSIGVGAFSDCFDLATVKLPTSLKSISADAFFYTKITSISIPTNVTAIGNSAFSNCRLLKTVSLPASLASIGSGAFYGTAISAISIPKNVTSIGERAFGHCNELTVINVDSLNTTYTSLNGVLFNKNKTEILQYPGGKSGTSYNIPSSVITIGPYAISECDTLEVINIPASVKIIGNGAFYYCGLNEIDIPDSVTEIADEAFWCCYNLTELNIPANVDTIGLRVFMNCESLKAINVDALNDTYASAGGVLFNKDKTSLIQYPEGKIDKAYSIPSTVNTIKDNSFWNSSIASLSIPDSVENIEQAFTYCANLSRIEIPDSVTSMNSSFYNCGNLSRAIFLGAYPENDPWEFSGCSEDLTIYYTTGGAGFPEEWNGYPVVAIDPSAKHSVTYDANDADSGSAPVDSNTYSYGSPVTMPDNTGALTKQYYTFSGWNTMADGSGESYAPGETYSMDLTDVTLYAEWQSDCRLEYIQIYNDNDYEFSPAPAFSPDICTYTLNVPYSIDEIYIDAGAQSWNDEVIYDYYNELKVGKNVIEIVVISGDGKNERTYTITITRYDAVAEKTFGYFKYINEGDSILITKYTGKENDVTVPDMIDSKPVTKIGMNAFAENNNIESVTLQDGLAEIGTGAFKACFFLKNVTFPDTLRIIGNEAFYNSGLVDVHLPSGLLSIGNRAFIYCWNLGRDTGSIDMPDTLTSIGYDAFSNCTSLKSFYIPDSLSSIDEQFLSGCGNLQTITIGSNPNFSVEGGVLFNSDKTTLIKYPAQKTGDNYVIPNTVTEIYEAAFDYSLIKSVTIPEGLTSLAYSTFEKCENLNSVSLPESLEMIDYYVFSECISLESITIPENVSEVSGSSFYGCTSMLSVNVDAGNEVYASKDGVLYSTGLVELVYYPAAKGTSFTIPSSVDYISSNAFTCCKLKEIIIGIGVQYIGWGAFENCDNITRIIIPDNVEEIGSYAFIECDNLSTATIGRGLLYMDLNTFVYCPKLAAVYFLGDAPDTEYDFGEFNKKNAQQFKSMLQNAPQDLKEKYSNIKVQGTIKSQAEDKLFEGCNKNLVIYKASGTSGYKNPWYGRPVKTFYPNQTCTVTFSMNSKTGTAPAAGTVYKYGKAAQPLDPVSSGNRFAGWYKESTCKTKWDFTVNTVSSNITLYAKWSNTSTITAVVNNKNYGTVTGGGTYNDGATVELRAIPKPGYRFMYWTQDLSGYKMVITENEIFIFTAQGNLTVTAQFAAIGKPVITSASSLKYDSVTLTWSKVPEASGYNIYRADSSGGTYTKVKDNLTARTYTDTNLQPGKTYYYKVSAYCVCDTAKTEGGLSSYISAKPVWETLNLTAESKTYKSIKLDWNGIDDADKYDVYRGTSPNNMTIIDSNRTDTSYTDSSSTLVLGATYYYKVVPKDSAAGKANTNTAYKSVKLAWPMLNLTADSKDYHSIILNWNKIEGADKYDVYRGTSPNNMTIIDSNRTDTSYTDNSPTLVLGTTYYYKVVPKDSVAGKANLNTAYKSVKMAWPTLNLTAVSKTYKSIILNWNEIEGADRYDVYRGTSSKNMTIISGNRTDTSYTDNSPALVLGTTYYYKVVPKDSVAGKANLNTAYKSVKLTWPSLNLAASSQSYNSIKLTWSAIEGAVYDVYRSTSSGGTYARIKQDTSLTTFTDISLTPGKKYYYKVMPKDNLNVKTGPYSSCKSAKSVPSAPEVTLSHSYSNGIIGNWTAVNGAVCYEVYRATSLKGRYSKIVTTYGLSFWDTSLTAGKTYYYKVRAYTLVGKTKIYGNYSDIDNMVN